MFLLQREEELREIVQLVGPDALPESERVILEAARMIREDYLMQSALHPVDTYCSPQKAYLMLKTILKFYHQMKNAVDRGVPISSIQQMDVLNDISRLKIVPHDEIDKRVGEVNKKIDEEFASLTVETLA